MSVTSLTPDLAAQQLANTSGAVLLDVRSRLEFDYIGHPPEAVHVAWSEYPDWQTFPDFTQRVSARLRELGHVEPEAVPVFCLCRSGARSGAAALALVQAGFREVYNIEEGFEGVRDSAGHRSTVNGWRARGLPWLQT